MASNPVVTDLTANTWVKVATNVTSGAIKKLSNKPAKYLETYRTTGGTTPSGIEEGAELFFNTVSESILSDTAIDVYVMAVGDSGKVRVDL